jgi:hypothetical protein
MPAAIAGAVEPVLRLGDRGSNRPWRRAGPGLIVNPWNFTLDKAPDREMAAIGPEQAVERA